MPLLLFWRGVSGSSRWLEVPVDATVADLKRSIQQDGGPPVPLQKVLYGGRELLEPLLGLADAGLCSEVVVNVSGGRLRPPTVALGGRHCLHVLPDGGVQASGWNGHGQCDVPDFGRRAVAVAAGFCHSIALLDNGQVVGWGASKAVPSELDGKEAVWIAAGSKHSLAALADGSVVCWGDDSGSQCHPSSMIRSRSVVAVSGGVLHSLALLSNGAVVGWGVNVFGQVSSPSFDGSRALAIAAGWRHSAALMDDGSVLVWGRCEVTAKQSAALRKHRACRIAAGGGHTAVLTDTGEVLGLGCDLEPTHPGDVVTEIAASKRRTVALLADGTLRELQPAAVRKRKQADGDPYGDCEASRYTPP
eukprot:TRINITY_DN36630_c0_g1_i1.p1 TRINITY_DN36630_c0_g1~~TRINITY_DN36630_c0_g1_i1.p1  ORF type:complete len:386 (+),score=76.87 TRINITY_DN36630_c0_g1_i1:77-1159(+)